MSRATPAVAALATAVLGLACLAPPAFPQTRPEAARELAPDLEAPPRAPRRRVVKPLDVSQTQRLAQAQALSASGKLDAARDALMALLAEAPHHPILLGELARIHIAREQWGALERLARSERAAARDSTLLAHELAAALERQSRRREMAQVVIELWAASPDEAAWCYTTLMRIEELEAHAADEPLRRAAAKLPLRSDIVLAAARLAWRNGDGPAAERLLAAGDAGELSTPLRWTFAEELLHLGGGRDTTGAIESLLDLAADRGRAAEYRLSAARRAWQVIARRGAEPEGVLRVARALGDLPPDGWSANLLVGIVRGLREAGYAAEVRAILDRLGDRRGAYPELALEGALNELREGPPERVLATLERAAHGSPEGVFRYAEALYFAGMADSAAVLYRLMSIDPKSPYTGPSLERLFLIEDADPRTALPALGRMAYETWRGEPARASALAESLYHTLPLSPLWAHAALVLGEHRLAAGDNPGALEPLLAVADSLPDDRLAPVARQRAGDIYRLRLKDDAKALAQYEECLARYPKAWNAPEVRRVVQTLRRERRF